jgi:hypothetical protein
MNIYKMTGISNTNKMEIQKFGSVSTLEAISHNRYSENLIARSPRSLLAILGLTNSSQDDEDICVDMASCPFDHCLRCTSSR